MRMLLRLLSLLLFGGIIYLLFDSKKKKTVKEISYVYRCGNSKIFHTAANHEPLQQCKSGVKKLTKEEALRLNLRKCRCERSAIS